MVVSFTYYLSSARLVAHKASTEFLLLFPSRPQPLALRPMSSTLLLSSLFPLYASKLFLFISFFPPAPMSLLCCCGCFYLVLGCGQSSSIFPVSLQHSVASYLYSHVIFRSASSVLALRSRSTLTSSILFAFRLFLDKPVEEAVLDKLHKGLGLDIPLFAW